MTRRFALTIILITVATSLSAGDIATFANLGFSDDSSIFLFGQYGLHQDDASPFAEMYAVDVAGNRFLSNGVWTIVSEEPLPLGQSGRGALYTLLGRAGTVIARESISHVQTGRPIYIRVSTDELQERVTFRDFTANRRFDVRITQEKRGEGDETSAAFYLDVSVTDASGSTRTMRIGRPGFFRDGVARYQVAQILMGPDEKALVIVVERESADGSIRYMVETTTL